MNEFVLDGQLLATLEAKATQANLPLADYLEQLILQAEKNQLLQTAMVEFPQGSIFIFDPEKRFIFAAGQEPAQAFLGRSFDEIYPPESLPEHPKHYLERTLNGETLTFEVKIDDQYYQVNTSPVHNKQGQVVAAMLVSMNITRLKQAQQSAQANAEFAERLANTVPDVIYIYDVDQQINVFTNRQVGSFLGYTTQQIQQLNTKIIPELVHPDDLPLVRHQMHKARESADGEIWEHDYRMRNADGNWRWIHARETVFQRNAVGEVGQILGVATDITERKWAEKQRLDLILQREKTRLIASFIQNSVHQFRTPLSIISTSLHLLENDPNHRPQRVERIREEIDQITQLVDDLATMTLLDSEPTASYSQMRVNDALRHLKVNYQDRADLQNLHIQLELAPNLPSIIAQALNFQLALQKIMENALLYTEGEGQIILRSALVGEEIMVEVQDNGAGILPEDLPHIFERFYRGKGWQYKRGFGLGLAIAQKVVQLHGWRITAESEVNKGSSFKIWLPLNTFGD